MKMFFKVLNTLIIAIFVLLIGLNLYIILSKTVFKKDVAYIFGYASLIVTSPSMQPELAENDLIVIHRDDVYNVSDIVTYKNSNGDLVTHRIKQSSAEGFTLQGDSNSVPDGDVVTNDMIYGKVIGKLSGAGKVIDFITSPFGLLIMAGVCAVLVATPAVIGKIKRR